MRLEWLSLDDYIAGSLHAFTLAAPTGPSVIAGTAPRIGVDLLLVCKHCRQSKHSHCGRPYGMRPFRYLDRILNQLDQSISEQAYPDRTETKSENDHCCRPDRMADRRIQLQVRH